MKLSNIKNALFAGAFGALALSSCSGDPMGPELKSASADFKKDVEVKFFFQGVEKVFVNFFLDDEAFFETTTFSEEVSWNLYVKGLSSGAQLNFSGLGNKVEQEDAHWQYGRTSTEQFFEKAEDFVAELHIAGLDTVFTSDTLFFSNDYNWHNRTVNGVEHFVIEGFEVNQNAQGLSATSPDGKDDGVVISVSDVKRISGQKSLQMKGTDANGNGWLGDINHERILEFGAANSVDDLLLDSLVNPDSLYFNLYVYGDPSKPNTAVEIKVYENDDPNITTRDSMRLFCNEVSNTLTASLQEISDAWLYDIQVNWEGWRLVSIPYSEFRAANSLTKGGGGNRIKESWRISGIAVSLLSFPTSGGEVSTYVDFLTVTQGGRPQY